MSESLAHKEKNYAAMSSLVTAVVLTGMKLSVGFYTNSLGILSEALHSGLDLLAAVLTLFAVRLAAQPADERHSYGHGKVENLAALAETALLLITCGWIIGEGVERLLYKSTPVMPSLWGVGVMGVSMALDFHRARLLRRIAKKHNSQALEADALHFSSDILSSAVVLVGLLVIWFAQYLPADSGWHALLNSADAIAALLVSVIVLHASFSLARKSVNALMDGGSAEMRERVTQAVAEIPGIGLVHNVRLRSSGPDTFVDLTVGVPVRLSVEAGHKLAHRAEACIQQLLPGADVTIHVEPFRHERDDEPLRVLQNCAAEYEVAIHGLHLLETSDGLRAELHAELPGDLPLQSAHERITVFENRVLQILPRMHIVSHVEPEGATGSGELPPVPCSEAETAKLQALVDATLHGVGKATACHRLTAYRTAGQGDDAAVSLSFHCCMPGEVTVAQAHDASVQLERRLRQALPGLGRIVIHMEPMESLNLAAPPQEA